MKKPRCYLDKYCTGHFCFEPIVKWIAKDYWGNEVARARTKKECIKLARQAGYCPER